MTSQPTAPARARIADALTASRFALAVVVIPVVGAGAWRAGAIVVAVAWWTDFFDGRLARTTTGTKLGEWDPRADTAVGVGIVVGLAAGGHVHAVPWLVAAIGLAVMYLATGNFAFGQLAQAVGYGPLIWYLSVEDRIGLAVLVVTIVAIAALNSRRFVTHTLPTFFEGVGLKRPSA